MSASALNWRDPQVHDRTVRLHDDRVSSMVRKEARTASPSGPHCVSDHQSALRYNPFGAIALPRGTGSIVDRPLVAHGSVACTRIDSPGPHNIRFTAMVLDSMWPQRNSRSGVVISGVACVLPGRRRNC